MTARAPAPPAPPLSARLVALSREAHRSARHEAAYHALTAAMHAAHDEGAAETLAEVEREAAAQIAWIDAHAPGHRLSTASAGEHAHPGVYAMLGRQAAAHRHMLARTGAPVAGE
jgi:hypothetical protein